MGSVGGYALAMREPQDIQSELAPVGTLATCMQEGDAMLLDSWQSREMLKRYGASAATERALAASARMSPGERL
jgi:hypothetical protein